MICESFIDHNRAFTVLTPTRHCITFIVDDTQISELTKNIPASYNKLFAAALGSAIIECAITYGVQAVAVATPNKLMVLNAGEMITGAVHKFTETGFEEASIVVEFTSVHNGVIIYKLRPSEGPAFYRAPVAAPRSTAEAANIEFSQAVAIEARDISTDIMRLLNDEDTYKGCNGTVSSRNTSEGRSPVVICLEHGVLFGYIQRRLGTTLEADVFDMRHIVKWGNHVQGAIALAAVGPVGANAVLSPRLDYGVLRKPAYVNDIKMIMPVAPEAERVFNEIYS
jgi:hypothetical protein